MIDSAQKMSAESVQAASKELEDEMLTLVEENASQKMKEL
jgi:hypothetical protein